MCINLKKILLDSFPTGRNDHDVGRFALFLHSCQAAGFLVQKNFLPQSLNY